MKTAASRLVELADDPLETLRLCGGYYTCPKDEDGKRLGPLVGYAGKYKSEDGSEYQWVGDIYANFAKAEVYPHVLRDYAEKLSHACSYADVFCGAPIGGYSFADMLGFVCDRRVVKAEKKVTALATADQREQSEVIFSRHELRSGDCVAIVEDVCNNFSTTDKLISLILQSGGSVVGIVCLLNRSLEVKDEYQSKLIAVSIPVVSLVRMPIPECRQDDLEVAGDIASGNIVWKPKDEWPRLMAAMVAAETGGRTI